VLHVIQYIKFLSGYYIHIRYISYTELIPHRKCSNSYDAYIDCLQDI